VRKEQVYSNQRFADPLERSIQKTGGDWQYQFCDGAIHDLECTAEHWLALGTLLSVCMCEKANAERNRDKQHEEEEKDPIYRGNPLGDEDHNTVQLEAAFGELARRAEKRNKTKTIIQQR
jgi:hypothetical protein